MAYYQTTNTSEFSEEQSARLWIEPTKDTFQPVKFDLGNTAITALRLDFVGVSSEVTLQNIIAENQTAFTGDITSKMIAFETDLWSMVNESDSLYIKNDSPASTPIIFIDDFSSENTTLSNRFTLPPAVVTVVCTIFLALIIFSVLLKISPHIPRNKTAAADIFFLSLCAFLIGYPFFVRDEFILSKESYSEPELPNIIVNDGLNQSYPADYEYWFDNHFGGRRALIDTYASMNFSLFDESTQSDVIIGENNWLFYSKASDGDSMSMFQNKELFSIDELITIQKNIEGVQQQLAAEGIDYVLVLAPNKETIYPEHYPSSILKVNEQSKLDQIVEHMRENSSVEVLDLRDELYASKNNATLYHMTDTHWNNYGAYVASTIIMDYVADKYPSLHTRKLTDYAITQDNSTGSTDLLKMANLSLEDYNGEIFDYTFNPVQPYRYETVSEVTSPIKETWTTVNDPQLPSIVIYHDSFFTSMRPFVLDYFERAYTRWNSLELLYNIDPVLAEQPDIVLHEIVERHLDLLLL